ncbi:MAG: dehydratase [Devosia sp.]
MTRWFEDVALNDAFPLGSHRFTRAEMSAFSAQYDPFTNLSGAAQPEVSGWHVASLCHRYMVDAIAAEAERLAAEGQTPGISGPSPGVNRMDFPVPVHEGDTVAFTLWVTAKRPSQSLPGWGVLTNRLEGVNQHGAIVYRAEVVAFSKLRDYRMPLRLRLVWALTRLPGLRKLAQHRR